MNKPTTLNRNVITRRQALLSLAASSMGMLIRPSAALCSSTKDRLRFVVIGDWGTGDQHQIGIIRQMFAEHQKTALDFVMSAGDNVYPNGSGKHFVSRVEQPFAELLKEKVSLYTVLGNHDVDAGRQDQCSYPLFNMGGQCYYTVKKGDGLVEFFMLDSTDFNNTQAAWLEKSLAASTAKWKVAIFHHPIYSSARKHGSAPGLRKSLEPLLTRYQVKVVFSGHDHVYERTKPQQGIQYFVSGAGGKVRPGDVDPSSSIRAASFDEQSHFMLIELDERQMSFKALTEKGETVDNGVVTIA